VTNDFFEAPSDSSRLKADLVRAYFPAWARVVASESPRVGYFDFFAGPGRYEDGTPSTPLLVVQAAADIGTIRPKFVGTFNDQNPEHARSLERELAASDGVAAFAERPLVTSQPVGPDLVSLFQTRHKRVPTLSFIDPWGYKGVTASLLRAAITGWGSEVIVFFNYSRINAAVANPAVDSLVVDLFGETRARDLQLSVAGLQPRERERRVLAAFGDLMLEFGAPYLIPFRVKRGTGNTLHYICFVTKHRRGYTIMKDIMASRGIVDVDEVPQFEYAPRVDGRQIAFEAERPLASLGSALLDEFAERTLTFQQLFDLHNIGRPFVMKNYRRVLLELEASGAIKVTPTVSDRRRDSLAPRVRLTFPPR